ncbi:MAG: squalene/phytoene synthase family protein [Proteobacteria bacterium]|nr:squalene/phytoene synthase family protein [Pseudomonadota bacterium]
MVDLDDLLIKTSRTFALSIPLLEGETRQQMTLAYLLLRISDTFEDAAVWSRERRAEELFHFAGLVDSPVPANGAAVAARVESWLSEPPTDHEGYLELLRATDEVLSAYWALDPTARAVIGVHVRRTTIGMAYFVKRADPSGELRLNGITDLRDYCYVVAGIVGEMLTELLLLGAPLEPVAEALRRRAATCGEALQLVNILKDSDTDADEGRTFVSGARDRERAFGIARQDLILAGEYVNLLQSGGAPRSYQRSIGLPVRLAWMALDRLEEQGPGSKVSRSEVMELIAAIHDDVEAGRPVVMAAGL